MPARPHPSPVRDDGFTLIEVLVAMTLIIIGLFPILVLVDKGNAKTATNLQHEAATNLAREIVERAHGVSYASLTSAGVAGTLRTATDPTGIRVSSSTGTSTWSINSRYDTTSARMGVAVTTCSVFAPSSRVRIVAAGTVPCSPASGGGGAEATPTTVNVGACSVAATNQPGVGVLLAVTPICLPANIATAVCTLLGPTQPLNTLLNPLIGKDGAVNVLLSGTVGLSVAVDLCGGSPVTVPTSGSGVDDAARQVRVTVTWEPGRSVTQTTVVPRS